MFKLPHRTILSVGKSPFHARALTETCLELRGIGLKNGAKGNLLNDPKDPKSQYTGYDGYSGDRYSGNDGYSGLNPPDDAILFTVSGITAIADKKLEILIKSRDFDTIFYYGD